MGPVVLGAERLLGPGHGRNSPLPGDRAWTGHAACDTQGGPGATGACQEDVTGWHTAASTSTRLARLSEFL